MPAVLVMEGASLTTVTAIVNVCVAAVAPSAPSSSTVKVTAPEVVTPLTGVQVMTPVVLINISAGLLVNVHISFPVPSLASSGSDTVAAYV